jgi:glutamine amidotransferase
MIIVIDYGMGNLGSVQNMLKKVGTKSLISSDLEVIRTADKLILPGVGAFDNGMQNLLDRGLVGLLTDRVKVESVPILGICLGAQLLTLRSEEGSLPGLGWIAAETVRFKFPAGNNHFKVPHMGWNEIKVTRENPLLSGFEETPRFYFVHSYHIRCSSEDDVLATSFHGIEFSAAIGHKNIMGTQFHPEKSHKFGLKVLANFSNL